MQTICKQLVNSDVDGAAELLTAVGAERCGGHAHAGQERTPPDNAMPADSQIVCRRLDGVVFHSCAPSSRDGAVRGRRGELCLAGLTHSVFYP